MTTDVENNEWKTEAPYLAGLPIVNPFRVPEDYFDALPSAVNGSLFIQELKEKVTATGFSVPENYFGSLKEEIMLQTSSSLFQIKAQQTGYSTPTNYFEKLQARILERTTEEAAQTPEVIVRIPEAIPTVLTADLPVGEETKMVRLWHSDFIKYASAACFILVTAFGLYLNQQNRITETRNVEFANEQMLYDIDEQDIIEHVQAAMSIEEQMPTASTAELETYILNNYSQNDLSTSL
ncbi:hypothetical protein ACSBL2_03850 [Pedobacter sp. AW31-3R]|uniref:hypothetical protein n=1 Tax=Pedobacter sp. AW31-3R TaxID=3445781 RepID=UPI003F9F995E